MKVSKQTWQVIVLCLAAIAVTIYKIASGDIAQTPDSSGYIRAWLNISSGTIDIDRTPVYPCVIGLAKLIAGDSGMLQAVVVIQNIVGCIAVWYFYKIVLRATYSENAAFWASLIFAIVPIFLTYRNYILTESLSMSGLIFLTYCALLYYDKQQWQGLEGMTFWLIFLVFIRPSFIYLLPVLAVGFLLMAWEKRKQWRKDCAGIASVLAVTIVLIGYMLAFKHSYGVFTMTRVGTANDFSLMAFDGSLDPDKSPDKSFAKYISDIYKRYGREPCKEKSSLGLMGEMNYVINHWSLPVIQQTVHDSKTLSNQTKGFFIRCYYIISDGLFETGKPMSVNIIIVSFLWGLLLVPAYAVWLIVHTYRNRHLPWRSFLILMLGASNIIIVMLGAQAEWGRLTYPSRFIFLFMALQLVMAMTNKRKTIY